MSTFTNKFGAAGTDNLNYWKWNSTVNFLRKCLAIVAVSSALAGCAVGQKVDYRLSVPYASARTETTVQLAVIDDRPYILSKSKKPTYVGTLRGLYYNPFNVNTASGDPLASDIQDALWSSFRRSNIPGALATSFAKADPGKKLFVLKIREWKTDGYMRLRFDYDITGTVLDESGHELGVKSAKGSSEITDRIASGSLAIGEIINSTEIKDALDPVQLAPSAVTSSPTLLKSAGYDECMRRIAKISDPALRISSMPMCDSAK